MAVAGHVGVRYRGDDGELVDTTLDRVDLTSVLEGGPVRRFRSHKGQRHYSGWYWSSTMGRHLVYESRLELSRLLLADFDPTVWGIAAQPFQWTGPDGGRVRAHVPDLLLVGAGGAVVVVDVKRPDLIEEPSVVAQFRWTRRVARSRGWGFEAWSGAAMPLLANVSFLAGYRRSRVIDPGVLADVARAVRDPVSLGALERRLARTHPVNRVRPAVLHAVWRGDLRADLAAPLGTGTVLQAIGEAG